MNKIKLTECGVARDGGTIAYKGSDGNSYYEDHRIGTLTKGVLYDRYPKENDARALNWNKFEKRP
jgi:hypothetical protein